MYRALILFAIFAFTEGHFCRKQTPSWRRPHSHSWRHRGPPVDPDVEIMKNYADFEATLQNYCVNNAKTQIHEVYSSDNYILKYDIPKLENGEFSVKIINRLMQVTARNGDGSLEFKDVRILPDILNYEKASWVFENKMLKIYVPYSIILGKDVFKECTTLNKDVIDVPVAKPPQFQFRSLGNDSASNEIDEVQSPVVY